MLQTPEERRETLEALGVAEMRILAFTRDTAETPPEVFLAGLRRECDLRGLVSGWNYTFGRGGEGGPDLLRREGEAHGSRVITVPPVRDEEGEIISSTAIRAREAASFENAAATASTIRSTFSMGISSAPGNRGRLGLTSRITASAWR